MWRLNGRSPFRVCSTQYIYRYILYTYTVVDAQRKYVRLVRYAMMGGGRPSPDAARFDVYSIGFPNVRCDLTCVSRIRTDNYKLWLILYESWVTYDNTYYDNILLYIKVLYQRVYNNIHLLYVLKLQPKPVLKKSCGLFILGPYSTKNISNNKKIKNKIYLR